MKSRAPLGWSFSSMEPPWRRVRTDSAELPLLGLELLLTDLAACVALTKDVEGRVWPRAPALSDEPANTEDDAGDHQPPEQEHDQHHSHAPHTPDHRMHAPVPLVITLLRPRTDRRKPRRDRKSTRLNSSHITISYAVFCLKKKKKKKE